jgi:hypothetical protein
MKNPKQTLREVNMARRIAHLLAATQACEVGLCGDDIASFDYSYLNRSYRVFIIEHAEDTSEAAA